MSTLRVETLQNNAGTRTRGSVWAWVNFNGTGTPSIRANLNISSITDNGVGDYTLNFNTAMVDANYAVAGMAITPGSASGVVAGPPVAGGNMATGSMRILTLVPNTGTATDFTWVHCMIAGN